MLQSRVGVRGKSFIGRVAAGGKLGRHSLAVGKVEHLAADLDSHQAGPLGMVEWPVVGTQEHLDWGIPDGDTACMGCRG